MNRRNNKNKKNKVRQAKTRYENGNFVLDVPKIKLSDFPYVSILTLTTPSRRKLFNIAKYNWENLKYDPEKIEWIIIDDPLDEQLDNSLQLEDDNRVKYFMTPNKMTIGQKRNYGVEKCSNKYVVHMDDDDYYFPDHILAKIQVLLKYEKEGRQCVCTPELGVYDIVNNTSRIVNSGKSKEWSPEATMAYKKTFWEKQKFGEENTCEGYDFLKGRLGNVVTITFWYNTISITHRSNVTKNRRAFERHLVDKQVGNFYDTIFGDIFKRILNNLQEN